MPRLEKALLLLVGAIFLPMIGLTLFLTFQAFGEGDRFQHAATASAGAPMDEETLYRVSGAVSGDVLRPSDYPEVHDALEVRATRQSKSSDGWTDDATFGETALKAKNIVVGGVPVELSDSTRIMAPVHEILRAEGDTERLRIQWVAAAESDFVAFGIWRGGRLRSGRFEKVFIVSGPMAPDGLDAMAKAGRSKGFILLAVAAVLSMLSALSVRAAFRTPKHLGLT